MDYEHVKANFAVRSKERFHMVQELWLSKMFASLDQIDIEF